MPTTIMITQSVACLEGEVAAQDIYSCDDEIALALVEKGWAEISDASLGRGAAVPAWLAEADGASIAVEPVEPVEAEPAKRGKKSAAAQIVSEDDELAGADEQVAASLSEQ
jgi:hypothetical protein